MPDASALDLLAHHQQKRARAQLSCTSCRAGKLKCNRAHPACDQCIKRSKESSCQYVAAPPRKKPNQSMKDRIKQLEGLVVELYNSNSSASPESNNASSGPGQELSSDGTPSIDVPKETGPLESPNRDEVGTKAFGRMKISETESKYVGSSHWEAILDNIAEVRAALDEPEDSPNGAHSSPSASSSTFGTLPVQNLLRPNPSIKPTRADMINALPPRPRADMLVSSWFNSPSPAIIVLHRPTFQREYQEFWHDPDSKPMVWIAILYGVLALACRQEDYGSIGPTVPKEITSEETMKYHGLAASAIIASEYTRPTTGVVEAIVLYTESVYMDTQDDHMEVWLLLALNIRLAFRMGYHREAKQGTITPFQAEMRRRSWAMLYMFDILLSFEMGLPGMVPQNQQDTQPPANLFDSDFGPESDPLPESRPPAEFTPLSYTRTKCQIAKVFGKVTENSHSIVQPSHGEVLSLDKQLQDAIDAMPLVLRVRPLEESVTDPAGLRMIRFNIDLLSLKSRCMLHRRFLTEPGTGDFIEWSRGKCIDGAMKLLQRLIMLDAACEKKMMPSGWYMSSLNIHDFLLGSMVVSLELDRRSRLPGANAHTKKFQDETEQMRSLLESTHTIWQKPMHRSAATQKASKAVLLMLSKVAKSTQANATSTNRDAPPPYPGLNGQPAAFAPQIKLSPSQQGQDLFANPYVPSSQIKYGNTLPITTDFGELDQLTPIGDMFDMPMDLDWNSWDNYIFDSNMVGRYGNGFDGIQMETAPPT